MCTVYLSLYISAYLALSHNKHAAMAQAQDRHCEVVNMKTKHVRAYELRCLYVCIERQPSVTLNTVKETTC